MLSASVENVLKRAAEDKEFRAKLHSDPHTTLNEYNEQGESINEDEIRLLVEALTKPSEDVSDVRKEEKRETDGFTSIG